MVNSSVKYEEMGELALTCELIRTLQKFENVISKHGFAVHFCASYRWEIYPAVKSRSYVRLVKRTGEEILSHSMSFFHVCTEAKLEELFRDADKEKEGKR